MRFPRDNRRPEALEANKSPVRGDFLYSNDESVPAILMSAEMPSMSGVELRARCAIT